MRAQAKRLRHEEEEESAFISMTDMTVGFLFIMMIAAFLLTVASWTCGNCGTLFLFFLHTGYRIC